MVFGPKRYEAPRKRQSRKAPGAFVFAFAMQAAAPSVPIVAVQRGRAFRALRQKEAARGHRKTVGSLGWWWSPGGDFPFPNDEPKDFIEVSERQFAGGCLRYSSTQIIARRRPGRSWRRRSRLPCAGSSVRSGRHAGQDRGPRSSRLLRRGDSPHRRHAEG